MVRLYKRVSIVPGWLWINLTTRGASLSAGAPGAHVTFGHRGWRRTVGLPGTGLYLTERTRYGGRAAGWLLLLVLALILWRALG